MKDDINQEPFIACPYCGAKYMPSEIFLEEGILGDAHDIVKTSKGNIENYLGKPYDLHETYVCDYCNKEFKVDGSMTFATSKVDDFEEEYVKQLYADRVALEED